ncbi:MAG TPA: hypothetical protein VGC16_04170 [Rhizomicrobium sp.]
MRTFFKAGMAFVIAALIAGIVPPLSPQWRAVAADLRRAAPPALFRPKMKAAVMLLLRDAKG